MSEASKVLPPDEWLTNRIDILLRMKGQIEAQYQEEKNKAWQGMPGPYSWLDFLVGEVLQIYRLLKDHDGVLDINGKRWRKLIGLDENSPSEQVEARLTEMREIFVEMQRVAGERRTRRGNES